MFSHYIRKFNVNKKYLDYAILISLILLAFYICFYKLGTAYLDDWDEAWYGEMAKQMLRTKEYIVLQWNGNYLFDKPPLYIWMTTFFSSFLGLNEFSIRITSALTGFLTIIIATIYAYKKWGLIPSLLTFSTLALNNVYIWRVRSGNLDALVTFLIFISFFMMISRFKYRYEILGLLFGLIYLAKASLVMFPLAIFGLHELLFRIKELKTNIVHYGLMVCFGLLVTGSWLYLGKQIAGPEFIEYYVYKSDQGVASISLDKLNKDYINHTYYSLQRRFFYVFLFGLVMLLVKIRKNRNLLLLLFSTLLIAQLSFTERDNNWYLVPSMPFWSLTIGFATYHVIKLFPFNKILIITPILLLSLYVSFKTMTINIHALMNTSSSKVQTETALKVNELSDTKDVIVRMDHLYPSAIYYADRKIKSSPSGSSGNGDLFIGRSELETEIKNGNIKFIMGKKDEIKNFIELHNLEGQEIEVNHEESIMKFDYQT